MFEAAVLYLIGLVIVGISVAFLHGEVYGFLTRSRVDHR
jgi:hypothetical protein